MTQEEPDSGQELLDEAYSPDETSSDNKANAKPKKSKKLLGFLIFFVLALALIGISFVMPAGEEIVSIAATQKMADNNGKIVHATGQIHTETFKDPMFQIEQAGIGLKRIVEMYQWVDTNGTFDKEWKSEVVAMPDEAVKSGHKNPPEMPFYSESWQVDNIQFDSFSLSDSLQKKVSPYEPLLLTNDDFLKLSADGQKAFKLSNGTYFFGANPDSPRIGDLKVSFQASKGGQYTILAKQQGAQLMGASSDSGLIEKAALGSVPLNIIAKGIDTGGGGAIIWGMRGAGGLLFIISILMLLSGGKNKEKAPKTKPAAEEVPDESHEEDYGVTAEADEVGEDFAAAPFVEEHQASNDFDLPPLPEEMPAPPTPEMPNNFDLPLPSDSDYSDELPEGIEMVGPDNAASEESTHVDALQFPENNFESDEEGIPSGIEMVGPDGLESVDYGSSNEHTQPHLSEPLEMSSDELEMPEGIEMIGPGEDMSESNDMTNMNFEIPEPPENFSDKPHENESAAALSDIPSPLEFETGAESFDTHSETNEQIFDLPEPDLDELPTGIEEISYIESVANIPEPEISEMPDLPSPLEFNASEEAATADGSSFEGAEMPDLPPPLEFNIGAESGEPEENATESSGMPDLPSPLDFDLPEDTNSDGMVSESEAYVNDAELPPLPDFDADYEIEESAQESNDLHVPDLPPPPADFDDGHEDESSSNSSSENIGLDALMSNIPDDFDPNAEMESDTENLEDLTDPFDNEEHFENTDEDDHSPFGDFEDKR